LPRIVSRNEVLAQSILALFEALPGASPDALALKLLPRSHIETAKVTSIRVVKITLAERTVLLGERDEDALILWLPKQLLARKRAAGREEGVFIIASS
jgi:hypothetical protein